MIVTSYKSSLYEVSSLKTLSISRKRLITRPEKTKTFKTPDSFQSELSISVNSLQSSWTNIWNLETHFIVKSMNFIIWSLLPENFWTKSELSTAFKPKEGMSSDLLFLNMKFWKFQVKSFQIETLKTLKIKLVACRAAKCFEKAWMLPILKMAKHACGLACDQIRVTNCKLGFLKIGLTIWLENFGEPAKQFYSCTRIHTGIQSLKSSAPLMSRCSVSFTVALSLNRSRALSAWLRRLARSFGALISLKP